MSRIQGEEGIKTKQSPEDFGGEGVQSTGGEIRFRGGEGLPLHSGRTGTDMTHVSAGKGY